MIIYHLFQPSAERAMAAMKANSELGQVCRGATSQNMYSWACTNILVFRYFLSCEHASDHYKRKEKCWETSMELAMILKPVPLVVKNWEPEQLSNDWEYTMQSWSSSTVWEI